MTNILALISRVSQNLRLWSSDVFRAECSQNSTPLRVQPGLCLMEGKDVVRGAPLCSWDAYLSANFMVVGKRNMNAGVVE